MAARKSCTHMTWSEAKAKSGDYDTSKKKKKPVVQVTHGQALTAKIVRKNSAPSDYSKAELRRAKKQEEKANALAARLAEEREAQRREREGRTVNPADVAREQMAEEAARGQRQQGAALSALDDRDGDGDGRSEGGEDQVGHSLDLAELVQCREMQLDEVAALEAIYADTDEFLLALRSDVDGLREKMDKFHSDQCDDEVLSRSIAHHPLISFGLQLTIEDEGDILNGKAAGMDPVASLLLQITFPPSYPQSALPRIDVAYFAVTDRRAQMSADKALESLVHLEKERLLDGLREEARLVVPLPCVYELAATWLTEHLFEYCALRTHAQLGAGARKVV